MSKGNINYKIFKKTEKLVSAQLESTDNLYRTDSCSAGRRCICMYPVHTAWQ